MHATEALTEAGRLMTICNSCRYCEGLCAVFPAMEQRRTFSQGDLTYLANLCHACGACHTDCQFAPPHEFAVNVPATLARLRHDSYRLYAWPAPFQRLLDGGGVFVVLATLLLPALFTGAFLLFIPLDVLLATDGGPANFYRLMPHGLMAGLFGAAFSYALFAAGMSGWRFWRAGGDQVPNARDMTQAGGDLLTLRYLDGGGAGCAPQAMQKDYRRIFHHLTFYGFFLCFMATATATFYHYVLTREAPYPLYDLPVVLGTLGGVGLLVGPLGLLAEKLRRPVQLQDNSRFPADIAFILLLFLTSLSGLALLLLRQTPAMGLTLAAHLGLVLALFITLPYSKMMHGVYRALALLRYARERGSAH